MHSAHHRTRTPQEMETVKGGRIILGLEINLILFYVGKVLFFSPPFYLINHYSSPNVFIF